MAILKVRDQDGNVKEIPAIKGKKEVSHARPMHHLRGNHPGGAASLPGV